MKWLRRQTLAGLVSTVAVLLFAGAALAFTMSRILASEEGPGLPLRTPAPRPDERSARDVSSARTELSRNKHLAAVIRAGENGDVEALLKLAVMAPDNYCAAGRELPEECDSRDQKVEAIYLNQPRLRPYPVKTLRDHLAKLFSEGGKPTLAFATRDSRLPEGDGGEYYLMFKTAEEVDFGGGYVANGLELKVRPGSDTPVQWFEIANKDTNPLEWIQAMDETEGAKYHILITPPSVKDWEGLQ